MFGVKMINWNECVTISQHAFQRLGERFPKFKNDAPRIIELLHSGKAEYVKSNRDAHTFIIYLDPDFLRVIVQKNSLVIKTIIPQDNFDIHK